MESVVAAGALVEEVFDGFGGEEGEADEVEVDVVLEVDGFEVDVSGFEELDEAGNAVAVEDDGGDVAENKGSIKGHGHGSPPGKDGALCGTARPGGGRDRWGVRTARCILSRAEKCAGRASFLRGIIGGWGLGLFREIGNLFQA